MTEHAFPGGEDAFVEKYFAPLAKGSASALGLKDDAAIITPAPGHSFVMTCDTLLQDRHFLFDGSPESAAAAAHKALAVNVSDLVAKAARPRAYLLSLSIPSGNFELWMPSFSAALAKCQQRWGLTLIGGDTVRSFGKLALTITAIGESREERVVKRSGATAGDVIFVSGTIGDALLGLRYATGAPETTTWTEIIGAKGRDTLIIRYQRPTPHTNLVSSLSANATAAIDVSDGFVRDLQRLCTASGVGADIDAGAIPLSPNAAILVENDATTLEGLITGGDDYEVIASVAKNREHNFASSARDAGVKVTRVGTISATPGLRINHCHGVAMDISKVGWDHLD